jgi:hypothetical protein
MRQVGCRRRHTELRSDQFNSERKSRPEAALWGPWVRLVVVNPAMAVDTSALWRAYLAPAFRRPA